MNTYIKNGKNVVLYDDNDLIEEVREYNESLAKAIQDRIDELQWEADYTNKKIDSDLLSYEGSLEEDRSFFNDLKDCLNDLEQQLEQKRLNREKLRKTIYYIEQQLKNVY